MKNDSKLIFDISASQDFTVYAIFPGQKIFLQFYHPRKTFNSVELKGLKTRLLTLSPTITVHMPDKDNCFIKGEGPDLIKQAHLEYENW